MMPTLFTHMRKRGVLSGCVFLVLLAAGTVLTLPDGHVPDVPSVEARSQPNIILIDIDRLNSDRMPCYGYHRNTTPHLCEFGRENIMFKQAVSQAGWTAGSISSVFTSHYTGVHKVEDHGDSLDEEYITMAEILKSNGYETFAFPALPDKSPSFIHRDYNIHQGFDNYSKGGFTLEENYRQFNRSRKEIDEPFFIFLQGFDPHRYVNFDPPVERHYRSREIPEEFRKALENDTGLGTTDIVMEDGEYYLRKRNGDLIGLEEEDLEYVHNQYDDSIKQADESFGEVIQDLKEKGIYSDSIIIVHANHGEMLDSRTFSGINRRFGHGQIWDDDIQVPLMIHLPEGNDETIRRQVELIDVLPTVVEEADLEVEKEVENRFQGSSLSPLYRDDLFDLDSYRSEYAYSTDHSAHRTVVRNSSWKLSEYETGRKELYNLDEKPDEDLNVALQYPNITSSLQKELDEHHLQNQKLRSMIMSGR